MISTFIMYSFRVVNITGTERKRTLEDLSKKVQGKCP